MIKNLNNKGFVFIETIITTVVLLTALLLLYNSYSKVIATERKKIYFDDITYVYETLAIRDVLRNTINNEKFAYGVEHRSHGYIYFFNVDSPIYNDASDIVTLHNNLKFYQLAYIKIADIKDLKACLNKKNVTDQTCKDTKEFINEYSYVNFIDYLKTLDVETNDTNNNYSGHEGILISIYILYKSGENISNDTTSISFGKVEECLQEKAYEFYGGRFSKEEAYKKYSKNKDLSFNVQCTYAYYYSWVYL